MAELLIENKNWSPDRKRKKVLDENDNAQEEMDVDSMVSWFGEEMIVDDDLVEIYFRQVESTEEANTSRSLFCLGRKSSRGCFCCRRHYKRKMAASLPPDDELLAEINKHFRNYLSNPENLESATNTLLDDIIEDAILGVVFEVHMESKTRLNEIILGEPDDDKYKIIDAPDLDIFGQAPGKKNYECICPSCNRSLAASRFAPHLEKCMGMGRNSSRLASKRIQTVANKETSGALSDDEDDADWTVGNEKKGKSKKRDKVALKRLGKFIKHSKNGNSFNSENGQSHDSVSSLTYENMSEADKKALLSQICGVVSEHTKKICTRTSKCPQHSEEQKRAIREMFLSEPMEFSQTENFQVDVDTYDEGDSLSMRESLGRCWETENSNTSSPTDSTSTCSSLSKKRHK